MNDLLITGATNSVGQHILYECLRHRRETNLPGRIALVVPPSGHASGPARVLNALNGPQAPDDMRGVHTTLPSFMTVLECDPNSTEAPHLIERSVAADAWVLHAAPTPNICTTAKARSEIRRGHFMATLDFLYACLERAERFVLLSTLYACGDRGGVMEEGYHACAVGLPRNPYEFYMHRTEAMVMRGCRMNGVTCQVLRYGFPSGRLMDPPLYQPTDSDLLSSWGRFFRRLRKKGHEAGHLRIAATTDGTLDVLPVDYIAKAVLRALKSGTPELNIAASQPLYHRHWCRVGVQTAGWPSPVLLADRPVAPTPAERVYYRTLARHVGRYLQSRPIQFRSRRLRSLMRDIPEPDVADHLASLFAAAMR